MRFFTGLWEHENFMDVYIEIVKVQYQDYKRAKLTVIWWNKGWVGEPFQLSQRTHLKITNFNGWKQLKNPIRRITC